MDAYKNVGKLGLSIGENSAPNFRSAKLGELKKDAKTALYHSTASAGGNASSATTGRAPQSSQTRLPQPHSNMRVMAPLSESTTARTSFIFLPQMRHVLVELSSTTQIFSARNISMSRAPRLR